MNKIRPPILIISLILVGITRPLFSKVYNWLQIELSVHINCEPFNDRILINISACPPAAAAALHHKSCIYLNSHMCTCTTKPGPIK